MPTKEALLELRNMALACDDDNRVAVAVELFTLYLNHHPDDVRARILLGKNLQVLGLMEEAETEYLKLRGSSADLPDWRLDLCLGRLYTNWAKHDLAEEHFRSCCNTINAPDFVWIWRGANFAVSGRLNEAEECHRKATTLENCDRDEAFLNLGYVLRARGNYAAAESAFRSALQITPEYQEALDGLQSVKGFDESLKHAQRLLTE